MPRPPKDVTCRCGHTSTMTISKMLCIKCGKYIFYDDQSRRRHRIHSFYGVALLAAGLTLITYFFVEMIVVPLFPR